MTGWPAVSDVRTLLAGAGITSTLDDTALGTLLDGAVAQFEQRTGWLPFVAAEDESVRLFDPPGLVPGVAYGFIGGGQRLKFGAGLVSASALTIGGVAKAQNTDWWLYPQSAPGAGMPYTHLLFRWPIYGSPGTVSITGRWGYCLSSTVPADAWRAVLHLAAAEALAIEGGRASGGMTDWTEESTREAFGERPYAGLNEAWGMSADHIINSYARVTASI